MVLDTLNCGMEEDGHQHSFFCSGTWELTCDSATVTAWIRMRSKDAVTISDISYQILHGSFLDVRDGADITAASRSRDAIIRVLNMKNNSTIRPVFSVWVEYNDTGLTYENNIPVGIAYQNGHICADHNRQEVVSLQPDAVTVTCTPRYAITLKRGEASSTSWSGNFNFFTGNSYALDKAQEIWNGRISAYGIRLMVQGLDKEHGLRGCELPKSGDTLEFDITLTTAWQDLNVDGGVWQFITQEFKPRVWSAEEFITWRGATGSAVRVRER